MLEEEEERPGSKVQGHQSAEKHRIPQITRHWSTLRFYSKDTLLAFSAMRAATLSCNGFARTHTRTHARTHAP
jgi:hypothetical protein